MDVSDMAAPYAEWTKKESVLTRVAGVLRTQGPQSRLSPLVFMTDPKRMDDPAAIAARLPRGGCVVYRHFDDPKDAQSLRDITSHREQQLLIGNDVELAEAINADGVHFSRDPYLIGPIAARAKHPDWIITMAGLKMGDYLAPLDSLDGLFISSIFPSRSPSAGTPIGIEELKSRTARLPVPVIALGGVEAGTALDLLETGAAGLAAIGGLIMDVQKEMTKSGHRFVIKTDKGDAELSLARMGDALFDANHTFTPEALRGQGVAGKLYAAMVADAKAEVYKVVPGCAYVDVKFRRLPEDRDAVGI